MYAACYSKQDDKNERGNVVSKPRYRWWGYVKACIRNYPALCADIKELHSQSLTASADSMPRSCGATRKTEQIATQELPRQEQREYDAVRNAVETTKTRHDGSNRMRMIKMVYWDRSHTLQGAAQVIHASEPTVKRWNGEFIRMVAKYMDIM